MLSVPTGQQCASQRIPTTTPELSAPAGLSPSLADAVLKVSRGLDDPLDALDPLDLLPSPPAMDREVPAQDHSHHMQHHGVLSPHLSTNDHSDKLMPNENNNTSLKNNNSSNNNHNAQIKTSMKNGHSNVSAHCQGSNLTSNNNSKTSNGTNGTCNSSSSSCSSSTSSTSSGNSKRFCNGGSAAGLGSILPEQRRLVDVTRDKPVKVTVRVVVPTRDHPKFNFVGKLLGPQGNSLKRLQEETMTKMAILGRGSMRDRQKEEELRLSGDPKFCHLQLELHVEVTALAPPAEAHARIALALAEVRRFLVPDFNDDIRQEQMWELHVLKSSRDHLKHLVGPAGPGASPQEDAVAAAAAGLGPLPDPACLEPSVAPGALAAGPLAPGPSRGLHSPIGPDVAARLFCARTAAAGAGRKRPYIAMSPTKRTVLSILARARAAQAKDMIGAH